MADRSEGRLLGNRRQFTRDVVVNLIANLIAAGIIAVGAAAAGLIRVTAMTILLAVLAVGAIFVALIFTDWGQRERNLSWLLCVGGFLGGGGLIAAAALTGGDGGQSLLWVSLAPLAFGVLGLWALVSERRQARSR